MKSKKTIKRILITPGEPAGIGPDVLIKAIQEKWSCELVAIADPQLLIRRAALLQLPFSYQLTDLTETASLQPAANIKIYPVSQAVETKEGELTVQNVSYVMQTLEIATQYCLAHPNTALVTGPLHKAIINEAGIPFTGHTEWLAKAANVPQTVMLFVVNQLKIALATTHLPLKEVSASIKRETLLPILSILRQGLINDFSLAAPRVGVCGLNPHAGENGYLGREEIDVISPLIAELQGNGWLIDGPLPADTIFTQHNLTRFDAILAMYHDQALPLIKYLGFDTAVNVTLGLPFIRTSVDHGTALDIAGTKLAHAGSMIQAIKLAYSMR